MNRFHVSITIFFFVLVASLSIVFHGSATRGYVRDTPKQGAQAEGAFGEHAQRGGVSSTEPTKRNELLRTDLNWIFGSKQQRGWYLYIPLINRLIETKQEPATKGFVSAVARWQEKLGLRPTGVLDDETFYKMIAEWQGRRIKDRTPAQPNQLIIAPVSDFYDPTRAEELRQVERNTYAAYKSLVRAALAERSLGLGRNPKGPKGELAAGENFLKIISSHRSRAYQEKLRRESPNSGSAGLAVNSPHFTGRALDLYVGGDPVDTRDSNRAIQVQTRVYLWLVRNAERFGFRPYFYEPWHWEYVGKGQ